MNNHNYSNNNDGQLFKDATTAVLELPVVSQVNTRPSVFAPATIATALRAIYNARFV